MSVEPTRRERDVLLQIVSENGGSMGNASLRKALGERLGRELDEKEYEALRDALLQRGELAKGRGRGGSVRLVDRAAGDPDGSGPGKDEPAGELAEAPEPGGFALTADAPPARRRRRPSGEPRARPSETTDDGKPVVSYRHQDRRKNNPPVGLVSPQSDPEAGKRVWAYDPHVDPALQFDVGRADVEKLIDEALASGDEGAMRGALKELKRRSDAYLNWAGKAERTSFAVDTVSLHVHERVDPYTILQAVRRRLAAGPDGASVVRERQLGLFEPPFEELPLREAIDFYKHERGWANRLIAGDSLLVMNSLLEKEGMAGRVQMIYVDPPYGIKYGSNFQPFVDRRDVKDRKDEDLTQEPEMIRAFRDTWELGIHSYLTYLRDRLLLARELLSQTGSIFVQISDENLHHVREIMDEVFGTQAACSVVCVLKTAGQTAHLLAGVADYVLWYCRQPGDVKYRKPLLDKSVETDRAGVYRWIEEPNLSSRRIPRSSKPDDEARIFRLDNLASQRPPGDYPVHHRGSTYLPGRGYWKTNPTGMERLLKSRRVAKSGQSLAYRRFLEDFLAREIGNVWTDTGTGSFTEEKVYVVQTGVKVIERCLLMSTDPGDLILDPTCGSGTTAHVAEKWGRRWITCDTSRVAITLAKQRLMTASYDYYELKYPHEGLKGGFVYKSVPHVTLKSIANNPEIDEIHAEEHPKVERALAELNAALRADPPQPFRVGEGGRKGKTVDFVAPADATVELPSGEAAPAGALLEWEVPFDFPEAWPDAARAPFDAFHAARRTMQARMDASIAAHADQELLYDQPRVDKSKLRITGPFTVEAVPSPTVIGFDELETATEADQAIARSGESARQHSWRDELLKNGVRGKKGQRFEFADLEPLAGVRTLHVTGTMKDTGQRVVMSFGPEHAALEQRQVELACIDASKLVPRPDFVFFCAFEFDPEAAKDVDEKVWPGVQLLKVKMDADLLTDDLKKKARGNDLFWLMGQPEVELRRRGDGLYEVEVIGFDYFDTRTGKLISGETTNIAVWMLDPDYDERSLFPRQVFFPLAGAKDGWNRLKRTIRAELDEELLEAYHGTVSLPFEPGDNRRVAVKVVDDRGIESLKILHVD